MSWLLAVVLACSVHLTQVAAPDCASPAECREAALAAAASRDYEAFHDLAWRAMQKGRRNDPELMLLVARAQSLSGRPSDALVMLDRLAALGAATDAATSDDFRRVRALAGWPALEARLAGAPAVEAAATPASPTPAADAKAGNSSTPFAADALTFASPPFTPAGLAYDAVSRRFIVGHRQARKLSVVDEFSRQMANLAGVQAGFGEVAAVEISPRDGELWVASHDGQDSTLHKLQLISARVLGTYGAPAGRSEFVDVAVAAGGAVLVLDAPGRRVLRLRAGGSALHVFGSLPGDGAPLSLAPAGSSGVYVGTGSGLVLMDGDGAVEQVSAADGVALGGFARLRSHGQSLVGLQRTAEGHRAVRLRLNRGGRHVTGLDVLDPSIATAAPGASTIAGNALYYLAPAETGMVIRRVNLSREAR